jgi:hypothetical protein
MDMTKEEARKVAKEKINAAAKLLTDADSLIGEYGLEFTADSDLGNFEEIPLALYEMELATS